MTTLKISTIIASVIAAGLIIATVLSFSPLFADANPGFRTRKPLNDSFSTSTAMQFMTAGRGTTTLNYDVSIDGTRALDKASLLIQFAATNSAATLNTDIQYSQDCIDYYASNFATDAKYQATSSIAVGPVSTYTFLFASSTIERALVTGAQGNAGAVATSTRILNIDTPTRCVRAVFYMPAGSGPGSVWAEFVGTRQQ